MGTRACLRRQSLVTGPSKVLKDEMGETASTFLERATERFENFGVTVNQVMTDNGPCYNSNFIRYGRERFNPIHARTTPYCPQANDKTDPSCNRKE